MGSLIVVVMGKEYELPEKDGVGRVEEPLQQHLLKMFAYDGSEERLEEVKRVLTKHFSELMDKGLDELWDADIINQEKLDDLRKVDLRKL